MIHSCQALALHCMDFRLQKAVKKYLEDQNLLGDCDIVSIAGGVKDLPYALGLIDLSHRLHHIKQVILINHSDCGAYGGDDSHHEQDLENAKQAVLHKYPALAVTKILARINLANGEIKFETLN